MPSFAYRALTTDGERVSGEIEAFDRKAAILRLQQDGLIPIDAEPAQRVTQSTAPRISGKASEQVMLLMRELAVLLRAGEPLERALGLVVDENSDRRLRSALGRVLGKVRGGEPLSDAFSAETHYFSRLQVGMVRAGEATGRLHTALSEIADLGEREVEVRRKLRGALAYPIVLTIVALASLGLLMGYVVPQFTPLFAGAMDELPTTTRWIIGVSEWTQENGQRVVLIGGIALLAFLLAIQTRMVKPLLDRLALSLPLFGSVTKTRATAQLARGLSTLLSGGVDLPLAISMTRDMISNSAVQAALARALGKVRQGARLADALAEESFIAPMGLRLLRTGEESGRLAELSGYLADQLEAKLLDRTTRIVALLEPLLVVTLGVAVGGIVISILNAVLTVNELAI